MILERIDTMINMSDHLTKGLSRALFHRNADFLLCHVPPVYSPGYRSIIGSYNTEQVEIEQFVPLSFTTPMTAAAARVYAPILEDYLRFGKPLVSGSLAWLVQSYMSLHIRLWGGVTIVRRQIST